MKNNINIVHASKNHKEFLIYANKAIDNVNNMMIKFYGFLKCLSKKNIEKKEYFLD